jgi:hypothetical protein
MLYTKFRNSGKQPHYGRVCPPGSQKYFSSWHLIMFTWLQVLLVCLAHVYMIAWKVPNMSVWLRAWMLTCIHALNIHIGTYLHPPEGAAPGHRIQERIDLQAQRSRWIRSHSWKCFLLLIGANMDSCDEKTRVDHAPIVNSMGLQQTTAYSINCTPHRLMYQSHTILFVLCGILLFGLRLHYTVYVQYICLLSCHWCYYYWR